VVAVKRPASSSHSGGLSEIVCSSGPDHGRPEDALSLGLLGIRLGHGFEQPPAVWAGLAALLLAGIATSLLLRTYVRTISAPIPAADPVPTKLPLPTAGRLQTPVLVGGYRITVTALDLVGEAPPSDPNASSDRTVEIDVRYRNVSQRPLIISPFDWVVLDQGGSIYSAADEDKSGVGGLPEELLPPNSAVEGLVRFYVNARARRLKLVFDSEVGDGIAVFTLN
jgi:hypothetical protein